MKKFFRFLGIPVVLASLTGIVAPISTAGAAEDSTSTTVSQPDATTTTTTTQPASSTTSVDTGSTSTPESGGSTTTTPASGPDNDGQTTEGDGADGEGTTSTTLDDPGSDEEPAGTVPDTDITVPDTDGINSSGRYAGQADFKQAGVLWSSVREAESKVAAAETKLELAIGRIKALRLREKELAAEQSDLDDKTRLAVDELNQTRARLQERALGAFVRGGDNMVDPGGSYDDLLEAEVQSHLVEVLLDFDDETIDDYLGLRGALDSETLRAFDRSAIVAELMRGFQAEVEEIRAEIEQAEKELETFAAGSEVYIEGLVFPIADLEYEVPMIDSFGFARMVGTADEHWHEGIDIFAPMGAPLVATERGVITNIGSGKLGGLKVWLRGASGTDWYYAHLSAYAEGLHVGQVVEAGDLLGYVGTSGNAVGTPPHLHMQVHPGGNDAINPYPMLWVVSERDIADYKAEQLRLRAEAQRKQELASRPLPSSAPRYE